MPPIPKDIEINITPVAFELLVRDYIQELGQPLKKIDVVHNDKIQTDDGTYQIDVKATFEALGCDFTVLIECKHHKASIKREVVQILYDKIRATGAHKGIIFTTAKFQEGTLQYAEKHGIALIQVIEGKYTYFTRSFGEQRFEPPPWADIPKYVGVFKYNITDKGHTQSFLQKNHMEALRAFIFNI